MSEMDQNQRIAETICEQREWDGQSFQLGDCVALLDGRVVAVAAEPDAAIAALRSIEPDASRGMVVEVARPETDLIW